MFRFEALHLNTYILLHKCTSTLNGFVKGNCIYPHCIKECGIRPIVIQAKLFTTLRIRLPVLRKSLTKNHMAYATGHWLYADTYEPR